MAAQKRMPPVSVEPPLPIITPLSGTYNLKVEADEISVGDIDFPIGSTYGWTWSGKTSGDLSGFMFVSLNYSSPMTSPSELATFTTGDTSKVLGGSWSKLIFINGQYAGSVSGKIVGGELVWNEKTSNASISLQLSAEQGTASFVGCTGKGTFEGTLTRGWMAANVVGGLTLEY